MRNDVEGDTDTQGYSSVHSQVRRPGWLEKQMNDLFIELSLLEAFSPSQKRIYIQTVLFSDRKQLS